MLTIKYDRNHNELLTDSSRFSSDSNQIPLQTKSQSTDIEFQELRQITKLFENLSLAQKKKFIASFIYT